MKKRILFSAIFGNILEYYDFIIYSYFSSIITRVFFPEKNSNTAALLFFVVFASGFLLRPLGGIIIGKFSDRHGRGKALNITTLMMGFGSFIIAFTPGYHSIGVIAPLIITFARLMQGFAQGGEFGSATSVLIENCQENQRGFWSSWQPTTQGLSALLGSGSVLLLSTMLSEQQLRKV